MQPVDREGTFKAEIESYGLKEFESGAVAVAIRVNITEFWNGESWEDWRESMVDAQGDIWIVSGKDKGNKVMDKAFTSLVANAGWDGDTDSVTNQTWQPTPCQVVVGKDDYKGVVRYRIAFINGLNDTPGGQMSNVDAAGSKRIKAQFGAQFRALAANVKRNGSPAPATKPAAPPPAKPAPIPEGQPTGFEPIPN